MTPEFADERGVHAAGFKLTTHGPLHAPPATPAAPFAAARLPSANVLAAPPQLHQWDLRQTFSQGIAAARPSRSMRVATWSSRSGVRSTRA
ncbi:MAG TPA: hypothetical protein VGP82_17135 [Ktedonobacterales bacterium]|nr:hypothetical protein [Ktedonobacterales bacterium]